MHKIPEDKESKIYLCDIDEVISRTKYSRDFIDDLLAFTLTFGILISIRMQDPDEKPHRRGSDADSPVEGKSSSLGSKSNPNSSIASGEFPSDLRFFEFPYQFADNSFHGSFPKEAKSINEDNDKIVHNIKFYEKNIIEIKKIGERICYSEEVPEFKKNEDGNDEIIGTGIKHYIQEAESLDSILEKMKEGIYKFQKIEAGILHFTYKDKSDIDQYIIVDLNALYGKKGVEFVNPFKDESLIVKTLEEFNRIVGDNNGLAKCHAPVFFRKHPDNEYSYVPLMVHAGYNGGLITGDADLGHLGIPHHLPQIAHECFQSKKMPINDYLKKVLTLVEELESHPEIKVGSGRLNREFLIGAAKATLKYYKDNIEELKQQTVGACSPYHLVMQCTFNNGYKYGHPDLHHKVKMWFHGTEDIHPAAQPEKFKGMMLVWNGKFYMSNDEKSYLDLLFMDRDILKVQELSVHPFWLERTEQKLAPGQTLDSQPKEKALREYWLDLIRVQALYMMLESKDSFNEYFDNLITRINSLPRKYEINKRAIETIEHVREELKDLSRKDIIQGKIDDIYIKRTKSLAKVINLNYSEGAPFFTGSHMPPSPQVSSLGS